MLKMAWHGVHWETFRVLLAVATLAVVLIQPAPVRAAGGNTTGYAWGENLGWVNFGSAHGAVTVSDTTVAGYAWSQSLGWVNLGPFVDGSSVRNDGQGSLSGYAWSEQLGWVNMAGVDIDVTSGVFVGIANAERAQAGRISFDCAHCRVVTTWRPRGPGASPGAATLTGAKPAASLPQFAQPLVTTPTQGSGGAVAAPNAQIAAAPTALFDITAKRVLADRWSWAWVWALGLGLLLGWSWWIYYRTHRRRLHGPHHRSRERAA